MTSYPEHEKLAEVKDKSQAIGEFLEWLTGERRCVIAEWINEGTDNWPVEQLAPTYQPIQQLIADYFEIDLQKLSEEKDAMLEEFRQAVAAKGAM